MNIAEIRRISLVRVTIAFFVGAIFSVLANAEPSGRHYFPPGAISSNVHLDRGLADSLTSSLIIMQEQPLYQTKSDCDNCTRLRLYLDRGYGPPIVIDIDLSADGAGVITTKTIEFKEVTLGSMKSIYNPAVDKGVRKHSADEVSRLQGMLKMVDFSKPFEPEKGVTMLDGEAYFLERMKGGRYGLLWHYNMTVHFWHWNESRFMEICKYVVKLSDARKLDATLRRN